MAESFRHPFYRSLTRPILFAGAPLPFLLLEVIVTYALVTFLGFRLPALAAVAVWWTSVHALAVWVGSRDPLLVEIYVRSLAFRDFYFASAPLLSPPHALPASVPGRG